MHYLHNQVVCNIITIFDLSQIQPYFPEKNGEVIYGTPSDPVTIG